MTDMIDLVVADRRQEAADVVSLVLRAAGDHPSPGWEPGAHIDIELASGLERQYSLCGGDSHPGASPFCANRTAAADPSSFTRPSYPEYG
ncbi:hypothetical protein ACWF99_00025 [Nocardia sp. NPDC055002]